MKGEIVELEHEECKEKRDDHDDCKEGSTTGGEHTEECSTSRSCSAGNHGSVPAGELGDQQERKGGGDLKIDDVVVVVVEAGSGSGLKEDMICRICHMNCSEPNSELIKLGCHCRGELGMSHPYCADTWFNLRGNRTCEICGAMAKNVKITKKPTRIWIVDFDEMRPIQGNSYGSSSSSSSSGGGNSSLCRQYCCNLLFICVVICLIFPWFFRINRF